VEKHVEKVGTGERTVTRVRQLQGRARAEELSQMLGASGEAAYRSAEEILEQVARCKEQKASSGNQAARSGEQGKAAVSDRGV